MEKKKTIIVNFTESDIQDLQHKLKDGQEEVFNWVFKTQEEELPITVIVTVGDDREEEKPLTITKKPITNLGFGKDLSEEELKKIADKLSILKRELYLEYGYHRINGGFCHIDMEEYDDEKIYVVIEDGIDGCPNTKTNTVVTSLWRDTLEWTD